MTDMAVQPVRSSQSPAPDVTPERNRHRDDDGRSDHRSRTNVPSGWLDAESGSEADSANRWPLGQVYPQDYESYFPKPWPALGYQSEPFAFPFPPLRYESIPTFDD